MSNRCIASASCVNGNCVGCKNGNLYCNDPRCYPNCPDCKTDVPSSSNWILITVILVLLGFLLILAFIIGYDWYFARKSAAEPKNITVNKTIHQINPPSIVMNSPLMSQMPNQSMSVPMSGPIAGPIAGQTQQAPTVPQINPESCNDSSCMKSLLVQSNPSNIKSNYAQTIQGLE